MTDATPTPLEMISQLHRTPDGVRPLVVGRAVTFLWCSRAETRHACHMVAQSTAHGTEIPRRCQRHIEVGLFYLVYQQSSLTTGELAGRLAYCAPCAIAEWPRWQIREAT